MSLPLWEGCRVVCSDNKSIVVAYDHNVASGNLAEKKFRERRDRTLLDMEDV